MTEERLPPSSLKGRLADVFVPALVEGALGALSRRLGNRASIDDPWGGRAASLASIEPLLAKISTWFRDHDARYRHRASTTGVDRDVSEGLVDLKFGDIPAEMPVAIVAERRRLREIELRIYYTPPAIPGAAPGSRAARSALALASAPVALPQLVAHVFDALKKGAVERVLAAFEEGSRIVDAHGGQHTKRDGKMSAFVSQLGAGVDAAPAGSADDGRTCCVEAMFARAHASRAPAIFAFERGDTGLMRELRLYYD